MPLPSYEDFKVKRQAYLEAKDAAINKAHHTYAEAVYSMFEKGLNNGEREFDDFTLRKSVYKPYGLYWFRLLEEKCIKEGWTINVPNGVSTFITPYEFELIHKQERSWLTRKLKGW